MSNAVATDESVSRVVDMLRAWKRETKAELAQRTGLPLSTLSRRLNGAGHWEWRELVLIADHYAVPMSVFTEGPGGLLGKGPTIGPRVGSRMLLPQSDAAMAA